MRAPGFRAPLAKTRKSAAAKPCERFELGPISWDRMESAYRESIRIASLLSSDPRGDALIEAKASFHIEVASARTVRKTRNDFAFVNRLRWAEQWIEIGLLYSGVVDSPAVLRALAMIDEAKKIFAGETSPGCAPPETEQPPLVQGSNNA